MYVYRPDVLKRDIQKEEAKELLIQMGYNAVNTNICVAQLMKNLKDSKNFPHEIGLFLGYPVEDVVGFINHRTKDVNAKACGEYMGMKNMLKQSLKSIAIVRSNTSMS